jgi:hypothetical protein
METGNHKQYAGWHPKQAHKQNMTSRMERDGDQAGPKN